MIYKAKWHTDDRLILGLAVADHPEGPYERQGPSPLFPYDVEDPFVWKENGRYWMAAKDMSGALVGKYNGVLLESENLKEWSIAPHALAWDHTILWKEGGRDCPSHMERPSFCWRRGARFVFTPRSATRKPIPTTSQEECESRNPANSKPLAGGAAR